MDPNELNTLPFLTRKMFAFEHATSFGIRVYLQGIDTNEVNMVGLTREGIFKYSINPTGDGTTETFSFNLPDFPTMISLYGNGIGMKRGEMWAELWLTINDEIVYRFGAGYISYQSAISWPAQTSETEMPNRGYIATVFGSDPAANTECYDAVPANELWILKSYTVTLVTDGTAANRNVALNLRPTGTGGSQTYFGNVVQTATQTIKYVFAPIGYLPTAAVNNTILVPIPKDVTLRENGEISTTTLNRQAGDNFGSPTMEVEKFMIQ